MGESYRDVRADEELQALKTRISDLKNENDAQVKKLTADAQMNERTLKENSEAKYQKLETQCNNQMSTLKQESQDTVDKLKKDNARFKADQERAMDALNFKTNEQVASLKKKHGGPGSWAAR